jgi:hypothetical protein
MYDRNSFSMVVTHRTRVGIERVDPWSNVQVGTPSATQFVSVRNTGVGPVHVNSFTATGDFSVVTTGVANCSLIAPLPAGAICSIAVRVTASVEGVRTGELTVVSTATNSPHIVLLSVGFLRILVGEEELAGPIDEQVVQLRPQAGTVGQSQVALDPIEHWSERMSP